MTKRRVLEVFSTTLQLMTPDDVCRRLRTHGRRSSVYSYLLRLQRQGLLLRGELWGRVAYRISARGIERLEGWRSQES